MKETICIVFYKMNRRLKNGLSDERNEIWLFGHTERLQVWSQWMAAGADPENFFSQGDPTLSKIDSVWRITVEVHKYEFFFNFQ